MLVVSGCAGGPDRPGAPDTGFSASSLDQTSASGKPIALRQNGWRPGDRADQALVVGTLEVQHDCVVLVSGEVRLELLWPEGWTALLTDQGLEIRRDDGSVAVRAGSELRAGGGTGPGTGCTGKAPFSVTDDLR